MDLGFVGVLSSSGYVRPSERTPQFLLAPYFLMRTHAVFGVIANVVFSKKNREQVVTYEVWPVNGGYF